MTLYFVLALSILVALWLGWRYFTLRRGIHVLTDQIKRGDDPAESSNELGELASAVNTRLSAFDLQLSTSEKENAKLSAILDQLTDGVLIADADGRVQFANPAAEKMFGSPLAGRSVAEAIRHHSLVEAWRRCQQTTELQSESVELPASRQFLQLIAIPDTHAGGSLLLVQDLTRVRRLETVRRDFISNLSHELRTPLASLKALTETLQDGALSDPEAGPRFLGRMHTEVDALTQMAQELLDLSKIESGQVTLDLKPIAPRGLLHAAADRMRLQAERAGVSLTLEETAASPNVQGDAARLEGVLVNLIHNAVKFTRRGGTVSLSANVEGDAVVFAVRDSGIGIPADDLPRIFERFYRVDKSRTGSGTGLGLSIARHIVEAHGGRIWAQSRQGEGSVFYFTIPL